MRLSMRSQRALARVLLALVTRVAMWEDQCRFREDRRFFVFAGNTVFYGAYRPLQRLWMTLCPDVCHKSDLRGKAV